MRYTQLGSTDVEIPVIGQGCMGVGGFFKEDRTRDEDFVRALQAGVEAGLSFLDTAEAYGAGHSEELVGQAILDRRDKVFLASKVSPEHLAYDDVLRAAERSLRRLQTERIDLYQVHWPNPRVPIAETMAAMQRLVDEGVVRFIGLSNFSVRAMQAAQQALAHSKIQSNQVEYNLFDRTMEGDVLPYCQQEGITLIAYTPLDKGGLLQHNRRNLRLKEIAVKYRKTVPQVSLKWLTAHANVIVIPKAVRRVHILENATAADFELSTQDYDEISRLFDQAVVYIPTQQIQCDDKNLDLFVPGADDLAQGLREGEPLKPVRVVRAEAGGEYAYMLVEGKLRYWAWVKAFEGKQPIPALVRGD